MASLEVDLVSYSDADFSFNQAGPFANGLANLGANPLHMQVRTTPTDPTVWIEATSVNAWLSAGSGGTVLSIFIPQSKLATLPAGVYYYSIIMTVVGGGSSTNGYFRQEVMRGTFTHNAGPTQFPVGTP